VNDDDDGEHDIDDDGDDDDDDDDDVACFIEKLWYRCCVQVFFQGSQIAKK